MAPNAPTATKTPAKPTKITFVGRRIPVDDSTLSIREESARTYRSDDNAIAARVLRDTEEPVFQSFYIWFKNTDMALAEEVVRAFESKKTVQQARAWMKENVGTPPEASDAKFTKVELQQIAIVALALTKYGVDTLRRLRNDDYVDIPLISDEIRDFYKQRKYREQSQSTQKDGKDVAHYLGLDVVVNLNRDLHPHQRVSRRVLRVVLNDFANFRLVKLGTNRGFHQDVDDLLLQAYRGERVRLTKAEYERVKMIVAFCRSSTFRDAMDKNRGRHLYVGIRRLVQRLEVPTGAPLLWEEERDKPVEPAPRPSASTSAPRAPAERASTRPETAPTRTTRPTQPPAPASAPHPTNTRSDAATAEKPIGGLATRSATRPSAAPTQTAPPPPPARASRSASARSEAATEEKPIGDVDGRPVYQGPKGGLYFEKGKYLTKAQQARINRY